MGTDLIVPEIALIEKMEEIETTLSPTVYEQMRNDAVLYQAMDNQLPAVSKHKRRVLFSDFVNKAINMPLEIMPELSSESERQLYRLHLFSCQQTVHNAEVRRNPLILGYKAMEEMHTALLGILLSYRLTHPECPYSWSESFLNIHIETTKASDGHTIVTFHKPLSVEILNAAITEEMVTDWLIYRAYDHNGIRTLMDIKNNLLDLPNYMRGGKPVAEFSRFERKMQEKRNRKKEKQDDALELEFRKTVVQSVAKGAVEQMLASGMSAMELLNQAFNGDLSKLAENFVTNSSPELTEKKEKERKKVSSRSKADTKEIENVIAGFLEADD